MLRKNIKALLNYSPLVKAAAFVADDLIWNLRIAARDFDTNSGSTHAPLSAQESRRYIEEVFADYKVYGNLDKFYGVAAEIGPGDNAGVALLMRRDGCKQVDLIDRYFSRRNPEQQRQIYEAIAQKYKVDDLRKQDVWDERTLVGINWQIGQPAEVYFSKCAAENGEIYNFIVSRAVLEHLYDPLYALHKMLACLKPGGKMFHKIDFRDHGMFAPIHHELTFLEIPSYIYPLMVRNSGRPNRVLVHRYRDALEEMKANNLIDYSLLVTNLVSCGDIIPHQIFEYIDAEKRHQAITFVEQHRRKFAGEFRNVNSQDLAIAGIFLIVTKK
ncbi:methyltransferase domain-containing protein [Microcoleus sp. FACHB-831]|uniref:methyltransferase domain-containing protein n=1 Tax=Microcoleus sp. FACHB-831 TaxID=2692827 RepID=UPI0016867C83|nr:methyltransferase domain-containing protein [Microcoleus sp. FACHB-831]MBD1920398.1 methyltransferase domain-containing protein [Microcoleus sp. FACHB-831]